MRYRCIAHAAMSLIKITQQKHYKKTLTSNKKVGQTLKSATSFEAMFGCILLSMQFTKHHNNTFN